MVCPPPPIGSVVCTGAWRRVSIERLDASFTDSTGETTGPGAGPQRLRWNPPPAHPTPSPTFVTSGWHVHQPWSFPPPPPPLMLIPWMSPKGPPRPTPHRAVERGPRPDAVPPRLRGVGPEGFVPQTRRWGSPRRITLDSILIVLKYERFRLRSQQSLSWAPTRGERSPS